MGAARQADDGMYTNLQQQKHKSDDDSSHQVVIVGHTAAEHMLGYSQRVALEPEEPGEEVYETIEHIVDESEAQ